ncbi:MAG: hypothetical protein LBG60_06610 [Bifidobacteriaceae bacterium]|jgi:hypothetical protein|nr:hypothetical protein [Bifidobacteriaceae bacterium]
MPRVVVYDANVLYPSTLRDVLIRVGLARLACSRPPGARPGPARGPPGGRPAALPPTARA